VGDRPAAGALAIEREAVDEVVEPPLHLCLRRRTAIANQRGDVEFALGETRYHSGGRIGTFLAVAQLDADGRMVRYMVARSPAIAFEPARIDAG
jgi:hypothetical protein